MVSLVVPQTQLSELPIFFNVDGVVGAAPAQNSREDVILVQFIFKLIADTPRPTTPPALVPAAKAVRVTGTIDQATITAIRVFQQESSSRSPSTVVDGRVSPARGGAYSYGGALWTIVQLNDAMQDRHLDIWPRIDKIPGCPEELKQMVRRVVVGK